MSRSVGTSGVRASIGGSGACFLGVKLLNGGAFGGDFFAPASYYSSAHNWPSERGYQRGQTKAASGTDRPV